RIKEYVENPKTILNPQSLNEWRNLVLLTLPQIPKTQIIGNGCYGETPITSSFENFTQGQYETGFDTWMTGNYFIKGYGGFTINFEMEEDCYYVNDGDIWSVYLGRYDVCWSYEEPFIGRFMVLPFLDGVCLDTIEVLPLEQGKG